MCIVWTSRASALRQEGNVYRRTDVKPAVPVGMPITGHPPDGSGRAELPHPALALGLDGIQTV